MHFRKCEEKGALQIESKNCKWRIYFISKFYFSLSFSSESNILTFITLDLPEESNILTFTTLDLLLQWWGTYLCMAGTRVSSATLWTSSSPCRAPPPPHAFLLAVVTPSSSRCSADNHELNATLCLAASFRILHPAASLSTQAEVHFSGMVNGHWPHATPYPWRVMRVYESCQIICIIWTMRRYSRTQFLIMAEKVRVVWQRAVVCVQIVFLFPAPLPLLPSNFEG
jgi:hypothetical protein